MIRLTRLTRLTIAACAALCLVASTAFAAPPSGAPTATTTAASSVSATTATLNGTVSPNGTDTKYYFQYGTSTDYASTTPVQGPIGGNADKPVSADVAGLTASTTYHYRLVATSTSGTVNGADMTFTTTAPGAGSPTLSIAQSRKNVTFGKPLTISGTLTGPNNAGVVVTLEENPAPYTGTFKSTGLKATTNATGGYSFIVSPAQNVHYRTVAGAKKPTATSGEIAVGVRVKVTLRLSDRTPRIGQRVLFSGGVLPGHDGKIVRIQRRTASGSWRTVATTTLVAANPVGATPRSKFAKRIRIRKNGSYRARVVPGDGDHLAGNSSVKSVIVH
jgi:hypothetical protein